MISAAMSHYTMKQKGMSLSIGPTLMAFEKRCSRLHSAVVAQDLLRVAVKGRRRAIPQVMRLKISRGVNRAMARTLLLALSFAAALSHSACGADNSTATGTPTSARPSETPGEQARMEIRLKVGDKEMTATLIDSETTRDFISLLPLTLTMNDLLRREKFAHLPRAVSEGGPRTKTYEVGDVIYWSPGPDVAIFYRHDGQSIPSPGIIIMGKIDSGVEALDVPGSVKVLIELMR